MTVDRLLEYNDSQGNGKFDEDTDAIVSYYGSKLKEAGSFGAFLCGDGASRVQVAWSCLCLL